MNIYSIKEQSESLEEIGFTISTPQRMKLELGLIRLSNLANSDQLLFWGKILTTGQSYYIAMSVYFKGKYSFPHKKFYYSNQNLVFQQFPQLDLYNKQQVDKFNHLPFSGNPNNILINLQGEGEEKKEEIIKKQGQQSEEDQQVVKIVPKNFTELDRLNYAVRAIELECQLVPVGAFRMNEKHQIRYNSAFHGFKLQDINIQNFQHFRYPINQEIKNNLESAESIFRKDIFDPIENFTYWSVQLNTKQTIGTLRSLIWPGYIAYHFVGRQNFGGIYFGTGCKMIDLSFYL